jgi:hypothetical protein
VIETRAYRLTPAGHGRRLELAAPDGRVLLALSLLAALDRADGADETLALGEPVLRDGTVVVERRSTIWEHAWLELRCLEASVEVRACVRGRGALTDVRMLGGRSLVPGAPLGLLHSGTPLRTLFSPTPEDGLPPVRRLSEGAVAGVVGDGEPGRARWLFTPAPLYLALRDDARPGEWLDLGLPAPVGDLRFPELALDARGNGFSLRFDYEGHTAVDGEFRTPALVLTPGVPDPFAGLRRHRSDLVERGFAPPPMPRERPAWWSEPIFCGWGQQCHLERAAGGLARDHSTQANYDRFLARLADHGVEPRTVVLDDKWQATYGGNEPDTGKWPDLKGWIAARHARGQHVLLWWKAWDPEGLPPELCVSAPGGEPVALDPAAPAAREELRRIVGRMLSPDGLDADGLKIDFTARTPTGRALSAHGGSWGIALLHELLAVVYAAAKEAKPDALVITHAPHPGFADVTDMIRLNDTVGSEPVLEQMRFRADVVRAACPELAIDSDDWPMPDKRSWREFLEAKPEIGVPSLYFSSHVDSGEELDEDDYAAIRRVWETSR